MVIPLLGLFRMTLRRPGPLSSQKGQPDPGVIPTVRLRWAPTWKPTTSWKAADKRPRQGWRINPNSGEHDRVAAADGPGIDHGSVNANVHSVVLSSGPEDACLWAGPPAAG